MENFCVGAIWVALPLAILALAYHAIQAALLADEYHRQRDFYKDFYDSHHADGES